MSIKNHLSRKGDTELLDLIKNLTIANKFMPVKSSMTVVLPGMDNREARKNLNELLETDEESAVNHFNSMIFDDVGADNARQLPRNITNLLEQSVPVTNDPEKNLVKIGNATLASNTPEKFTIQNSDKTVYVYYTLSGEIGVDHEKTSEKNGGAMLDKKLPVDSLFTRIVMESRNAYFNNSMVNPVAEFVLSVIYWGKKTGNVKNFIKRIKPLPELSFVGLITYFKENPQDFTDWLEKTRGKYLSSSENIHEEYLNVYDSLYELAPKDGKVRGNFSSRPEISKSVREIYKSAFDLHSDEAALIGISDLKEMVSCELNKDFALYNNGSAFGPLKSFLDNVLLYRCPTSGSDFASTISTKVPERAAFDTEQFVGITHLLVRSDMLNYSLISKSQAEAGPTEITFNSKGQLPSESVSVAGYYYKLQKNRIRVGAEACLTKSVASGLM